MTQVKLKAESKNKAKAAKIRAAGMLPAIVYGRGFENMTVTLDYREFEQVLAQAGESTLVDLSLAGQVYSVLIQDVQRDPVTDKIIHADFHRVRMDEKVHAEVMLKFVGASLAVKTKGGVLVKALEELEIEALPSDLVHEIEVSVSGLADFGQRIHVKDLVIPPGLTVLNEPDLVVAVVEAPRAEEELSAKPEETEKEAIEAQEKEVGAKESERDGKEQTNQVETEKKADDAKTEKQDKTKK